MFTKKPTKQFPAVEGANVTLEWRYTFTEEETFRQAVFAKGNVPIVEKLASDSAPLIQSPYSGRLHVNITNGYTSITFLGVNRLDKRSYRLEVSTYPYGQRSSSEVEISVLCKYKELRRLHKPIGNNFSSL